MNSLQYSCMLMISTIIYILFRKTLPTLVSLFEDETHRMTDEQLEATITKLKPEKDRLTKMFYNEAAEEHLNVEKFKRIFSTLQAVEKSYKRYKRVLAKRKRPYVRDGDEFAWSSLHSEEEIFDRVQERNDSSSSSNPFVWPVGKDSKGKYGLVDDLINVVNEKLAETETKRVDEYMSKLNKSGNIPAGLSG